MLNEYEQNQVIPELKKLKEFFEHASKLSETQPNGICGYFANQSIFFGNVIECNSFKIPSLAMKIIYEANKEDIEQKLKEYDN